MKEDYFWFLLQKDSYSDPSHDRHIHLHTLTSNKIFIQQITHKIKIHKFQRVFFSLSNLIKLQL